MIEVGSVVELENLKKYMITASSIENSKVYYLALEVDYDTLEPKEESLFFEETEEGLLPITSERDIYFLRTIFVDNFIKETLNEIEEENVEETV